MKLLRILLLGIVMSGCVFLINKKMHHTYIKVSPEQYEGKDYCTSNEVSCITDQETSFLIMLDVHRCVHVKDFGGFRKMGYVEGWLANNQKYDVLLEAESDDGLMAVMPSLIPRNDARKIIIYRTADHNDLTNGVVRLFSSKNRELRCELHFHIME